MSAFDRDTDRDFGRVLEDFDREQDLRLGREQDRGEMIRQDAAEAPSSPPRYERPAEEEDFAAALEAFDTERPETTQTRRLSAGEAVEGRLVSLDLETGLVDLGGKAEAVIATAELLDEDGALVHEVGDRLRVEILGPDEATGALRVRKLGAGVASSREQLEPGALVEGVVAAVNKGGVEVEIGSRKAFCPFSQLADRRVEDAEAFVGRRLRFEVLRAEGRGDLVLSRRKLLEREAAERAAAVRESLAVGAVVRGRVTALADYGAFIDLGGLEGLVHVSQISHRRVRHPEELLQVGQEVDVRVETLERQGERERVSLSMRALERDPWLDAVERYTEGSVHTGRVTRLEAFGAFVELEAGVEGLAPIGELGGGRRLSHPREVLKVDQSLPVRVIRLDRAKQRISLAPADAGEVAEDGVSIREMLERHGTSGGALGGSLAAAFQRSKKR